VAASAPPLEGANAKCFISDPHRDEKSGVKYVTVAVLKTDPKGSLVRWIDDCGIIAECAEGDRVEIESELVLNNPELQAFVIPPTEAD
jgi:hypothetical protein